MSKARLGEGIHAAHRAAGVNLTAGIVECFEQAAAMLIAIDIDAAASDRSVKPGPFGVKAR